VLTIVALRRDETQLLTNITQHDIAAPTAPCRPARQLLLRSVLQEQTKQFAENDDDDDDDDDDDEEDDDEEDDAR
jgi:phosphopantothenoylcysteine synthetase/decarboxylase